MGGATLWPGETPAFLWDVTITAVVKSVFMNMMCQPLQVF